MGSRQSGQTWSAAALSCILLLPSLCYASSQIAPISVPVGTDWYVITPSVLRASANWAYQVRVRWTMEPVRPKFLSKLTHSIRRRVNIRVGTPPQWLSVFPSTASQETWVVGRYGCDGCEFTQRTNLYREMTIYTETTRWGH
jgi:hypothetical protein